EAIDLPRLGEAAVGAGNLAIPLVKQLTAQVKARHEAIDLPRLGEAAVGAGNLAIPLVKQLTAQVKAR
ncbi:hypothetical protein CKJ90_33285, partial [Klebsiella pneumoniae]